MARRCADGRVTEPKFGVMMPELPLSPSPDGRHDTIVPESGSFSDELQ